MPIDPPPEALESVIAVRAPKGQRCKNVQIFGHRDPRGPDNTVSVWVDKQDKLHIRILKAKRCYQFKEVIETPDFVEIVQE